MNLYAEKESLSRALSRTAQAARGDGALGDTNQTVNTASALLIESGNPYAEALGAQLFLWKSLGLFKDKKKQYKTWDPVALQAVQAYGPNFVKGAQALEFDPSLVASTVSDYLSQAGVNIAPAQLLASQQNTGLGALLSGNMPIYLIAGGGLVLLLLLRKK